LCRVADEARGTRDAVAEDERAESPGLGRSASAAIERSRQAAFRVGERDEYLLARSARFADTPERLLELVLPELDLERPDDRHGNDRSAGQHLLRVHVGRQVDSGDAAVEAERLLARLDRSSVVLARPP